MQSSKYLLIVLALAIGATQHQAKADLNSESPRAGCHWRLVRQCFADGRVGPYVPTPIGRQYRCVPPRDGHEQHPNA